MSDSRYRISDDERDEAIHHLRTALAEGRLSVDEHQQRTQEVLRARTNEDLHPLFEDLPLQLWPSPIGRPLAPSPRAGAPAPKDTKAPAKKKDEEDGNNIPGLAGFGGFLFLVWGLPAMVSGGTWSVLIFLGVLTFMVLVPIGSQLARSRRNKHSGA